MGVLIGCCLPFFIFKKLVFFVVVLYAHISTLLFAVLSSPLYYPSVLYRTVTASAQIDLRQLQILNYAISMLLPPTVLLLSLPFSHSNLGSNVLYFNMLARVGCYNPQSRPHSCLTLISGGWKAWPHGRGWSNLFFWCVNRNQANRELLLPCTTRRQLHSSA